MTLNEALTILVAASHGEINYSASDDTRHTYNLARSLVGNVATELMDAHYFTSKPKTASAIGEADSPPWEIWMRNTKRDGVVKGLLMAKRLVAYANYEGASSRPILDIISEKMKAVEEGAVEIW